MPDRAHGLPEGFGSPLRVLRVVWERKWLVIACVIVSLGVATASVSTAEKKYESTAELLLRDPGFARTLFGSDLFESGANPERDTSTTLEVIESAQVTERVVRALDGEVSGSTAVESIDVNAGENSDIVSIAATTADPKLSARLANAYAREFVNYTRERDRAKVRDAQRLMEQTLEAAPPEQQQNLLDSLRQLTVLEALQTGQGDLLALARPNTDPASPKPFQAAALAGVLGLLLGVAVALLADLIDRRLKTAEDFERAFGHPVLVSVPRGAVPAEGEDALVGAQAEPYRMLREGLRFLEVAGDQRCVLITSPDAGEGKTTVAVNLARALIAGGDEVILIEADLRRPMAARQLGIDRMGIGLSSALVGTRGLRDLLVSASANGKLRVLPTGPAPPNPADLLRSPRMAELLAEAREAADVVLVDAPPLLPVSDTRVLLDLPGIDGVLIVGRAKTTRRDRARAAARVLAQSERRMLGVVLTGTRERLGDYYYYGSDVPDVPGPGDNGVGATWPVAPTGRRDT
jgi:capsular exopolysaccharide synthesis family protein